MFSSGYNAVETHWKNKPCTLFSANISFVICLQLLLNLFEKQSNHFCWKVWSKDFWKAVWLKQTVWEKKLGPVLSGFDFTVIRIACWIYECCFPTDIWSQFTFFPLPSRLQKTSFTLVQDVAWLLMSWEFVTATMIT